MTEAFNHKEYVTIYITDLNTPDHYVPLDWYRTPILWVNIKLGHAWIAHWSATQNYEYYLFDEWAPVRVNAKFPVNISKIAAIMGYDLIKIQPIRDEHK